MEIITLQFGHYSNYIGTHWWNIQEASFQYDSNAQTEVNHDVLYREGATDRGQTTFTPRLLLADLKGSLKSLPERGNLYCSPPELEPAASCPDATLEVISQAKHPPNKFQQQLEQGSAATTLQVQDLEKEVKVWSDFLYARFHPRTVNIVNEYQHDGPEDVGFDLFPLGTDLWQTGQFAEEYCDRLRSYMEECDGCQGFQVLLDGMDGFGGLAASCMQHLRDEYGKKAILSLPCLPSHHGSRSEGTEAAEAKRLTEDSVRVINMALCLDVASLHSDLTVPLCAAAKAWRRPAQPRVWQHVHYDMESHYHTSALLASALDTLTLAYRLKAERFTLGDMCAGLGAGGRRVAAASLALPLGLPVRTHLIDWLDAGTGNLWQPLTPHCHIPEDRVRQLVTVRGVPLATLKAPPHQGNKQENMPAYQCRSVKEMLELYLTCNSFCTTSHVTSIAQALPVKVPFPELFDKFVSGNGHIDAVSARTSTERVQSVPVMAGCHNASSVGDMVESLHTEASRLKFARFHQFRTAGLESDEYQECLHRIQDLRDNYEERFE